VKQNKLGFIILCPNLDVKQLENTIESVKNFYSASSTLVVLAENPKAIIRNLSQLVVAEDNLVGMLNKGLELSICNEWNLIVRTPRWLNANLDKKFFTFMKSDKDIFFPITRKNWNFTRFDLHGLLLHKKTFCDVGEFPKADSLEESKILWAATALGKGYKLKGVNFTALN